MNLGTMLESRANSRRPRLPQFQRTSRILVHKHAFDRDNIRLEFIDDSANGLEDLSQAIRKLSLNAFHSAARHVQSLGAVKIDHAEAG